MKVSEITLSQYAIKCIRPNNFNVVSIDYISNTIGIVKQNIETWSIMDFDTSTIKIIDEPNPILPIYNRPTQR